MWPFKKKPKLIPKVGSHYLIQDWDGPCEVIVRKVSIDHCLLELVNEVREREWHKIDQVEWIGEV